MSPPRRRHCLLSLSAALLLHAGLAIADLGPPELDLLAYDFEVSQPVSLTGLDRAGADPLAVPGGEFRELGGGPASITVYVSMRSNWLNATERQSIFNLITARYTFASTLIEFTTVQPTSGSWHVIDISPGDDPDGADGAFGWAPGSTATVYAGRYTVRRSTWFSSTQSRVNAIGETGAHELDHILRGPGHTSDDPGDLNASGHLVPYDRRAANNRTFSTRDQAQKVRNILAGITFTPYDARDRDERCGCHIIYGQDESQMLSEPDDKGVSVLIQLPDPEFGIGLMTAEGPWTFSDGQDPPGEYSIVIPGDTVVDWTLVHEPTGEFFPISEFGVIIIDPTSAIDPFFSNLPPVGSPYFSRAVLGWEGPFGAVQAQLQTFGVEGFQINACAPIPVQDELRGFNAVGAPGSVLLTWVVTEPGAAVAFHIDRSDEVDGAYTRLTEAAIPNRTEAYPATLSYEDTTAEPGRTAYYKLEVILRDGRVETWPTVASAAALSPQALIQLSLKVIGPAPARDIALLSLGIPGDKDQVKVAMYKVAMYDVGGRHVATLVDGELPGGMHQIPRDLRSGSGQRVPVGVYFARLETTAGVRTAKIVVLK